MSTQQKPDAGRQKFGIYFLVSKVELIQVNEVAA